MIIVASVGVNSLTDEKIRKMILAGADIFRFNFSYRSIDENIRNIETTQDVISDLHAGTKILFDLPVKKYRLGYFDLKAFAVRENEEFIFKYASYSPDCNEFIPVNINQIGNKVDINQTVTISDGEIAIQITEIIDSNTIRAKILNNGIIYFNKSFNIKYYRPEQELLTEYKQIIEQTKHLEPNYIAVPFINANFNIEFKNLIKQQNINTKLIIKIEHQIDEGELKSIIQDTDYDMILMDRGEMGVNLPFEKVGLWQKHICMIAKQYKKKILISTQILESTINNFVPHRSEILDLTNMILDRIDGIIFCHETGFGMRPAYSIHVAKKIINEVEKHINNHKQSE
ncbi:MAG: pyruvate kinase [Candidatus Magasanikbacteria bacterium]|jgi:pyruvate kinase